MSSPEIEVVEGADVVISFEGKRRIHARFCVLQQPGVFKANIVGPWIVPDEAASTEGPIATAENCPSGAIRYKRKDGGLGEATPPVNLMQMRENGPQALRRALILDGNTIGFRATFCRCGASNNKLFCDSSHEDAGFTATGEPTSADVTPLAKRDGEVAVAPLPNGLLRVAGNLKLLSGPGRTIHKATELYLCRSGGSGRKAYCDGSHARVGFKA